VITGSAEREGQAERRQARRPRLEQGGVFGGELSIDEG
jgi:hypothetical protein